LPHDPCRLARQVKEIPPLCAPIAGNLIHLPDEPAGVSKRRAVPS